MLIRLIPGKVKGDIGRIKVIQRMKYEDKPAR